VNRRKLRQAIWRKCEDFEENLGQRIERWEDQIYGVNARLQRGVCAVLGHISVEDSCGIPEHDYCVCCMKITPNRADRSQ
jgi:hypothetical protein